MKKYLAIINGMLTPWHVVESVLKTAAATSSFLEVIFMNYSLELLEYHYPFPNDLSLTRKDLIRKNIEAENDDLLNRNLSLINNACLEAKINFKVTHDPEITLGNLITYSAFNDVIFADANENLGNYHIADLLTDAHCPIYLISKDVGQIENLIFTYNGTFSSIYALKMFSAAFPELKKLPAKLVYVAPEKWTNIPQEQNMKDWLSIHFPTVQTTILFGDVYDELVNFTKALPNSLTIMGSFGRSAMSRFFHKSLAHRLIEDGHSSLFIAHE